jgi:hypothetical protein
MAAFAQALIARATGTDIEGLLTLVVLFSCVGLLVTLFWSWMALITDPSDRPASK